ncbi:hypothetical protein D3C84_629320 [compost metagenome]
MNALGLGRLVQRTIERAAADDDFPATEVRALRRLGVEQHLQDGRHAMGEADFFLAPQLHQVFRVVTAGVDLLEAQHGGHIRQPPGMHVEHRGNRHVHVAGAQQADAVDAAHDRRNTHGVQHQLPMGKVHPLGIAGGAGGIEGRCHRVLVEILEGILRARGSQQLFVLAHQVRQVGGFFRQVGQ